MNATQALALIEPIPSNDFLLNKFTNSIDKCCVVGHLTRLTSEDPTNYSQINCSDIFNHVIAPCGTRYLGGDFRELTAVFAESKGLTTTYTASYGFVDISSINNKWCPEYQQDEPKDRCVAFLQDMIKAGY